MRKFSGYFYSTVVYQKFLQKNKRYRNWRIDHDTSRT